jgi:integrator complex subunit 11
MRDRCYHATILTVGALKYMLERMKRLTIDIFPSLFLSFSRYATTIRDSKRARERDFLKKVHDCVAAGGKVLIPVFALGRAQELCILIETYWERMALKVPVYFSGGLTGRANEYYKLFINWTNEKIKNTFVKR